MLRQIPTDEVRAAFDGIFGPGAWDDTPEPTRRGVRLKITPSGRLAACHPKADGPNVIKIQQVPAGVSLATVLRRMEAVTVLRRDKTLHYSEIKAGAILR